MGAAEEEPLTLQKSELINLDFNKDGYFESDIIIGSIKFEPPHEIKVNKINITITRFQSFIVNSSKEKILRNDNQEEIQFEILNNIPAKSYPRGIHRIPFHIFLPENIPPSFECQHKLQKAFIRYILTAEIISNDTTYKHEEYLLIQQKPFNIPNPLIYLDQKTIKTSGESCISLHIATSDIIINKPMKLAVEIDNTKCGIDVIKIKIKIYRRISFTKDYEGYIFENMIIKKKYPIECLKGEKNKYEFEDILFRDEEIGKKILDDKLNPYLNKVKDLNLLMPSLETELIKCEYFMKVTPKFDTSISEKDLPIISIPIYAVHLTKIEYDDYNHLKNIQWNNINLDKEIVLYNIGKFPDPFIREYKNNGNNGNIGNYGNNGNNGNIGNYGINGNIGNYGNNGNIGNYGINGNIGNYGINGNIGNYGINGNIGNYGINGNIVNYGNKGNNGNIGIYGNNVNQGNIGNYDIGNYGNIGNNESNQNSKKNEINNKTIKYQEYDKIKDEGAGKKGHRGKNPYQHLFP